jgi:exodeoxyribonuclease-3
MKLVTWNVNSLNVRMPRLLELLELHAPDVVALQETKVDGSAFPETELRQAGYAAVHHSAGRWAGVALLVRDGLAAADPSYGLPGEVAEDEARWVEATVRRPSDEGQGLRIASVYVPNGRAVGTPTYEQKLRFLEAMARRAGAVDVIAGDMNVCPTDVDVYDPAAFAGSTHVQPEERERLAAVAREGGLVDAYRQLHPEPEVGFTWWDYRQGHFHRKMGLRIDLALVSAERVAPTLRSCGIDRNFRKGPKPSDHAPLLVDWD